MLVICGGLRDAALRDKLPSKLACLEREKLACLEREIRKAYCVERGP